MRLLVVFAITLVLVSLTSSLPSNPRTNNFASSGQYSPRDDARMYDNRGLQFEGPRSYNTNSNVNSNFQGGRPQGFHPDFPSASNNPQPSSDYHPQGHPGTLHPGHRRGGNSAPSLPGIIASRGTMDSHLRPRPPQATGGPVHPSNHPMRPTFESDQPTEVKPAFAGCERHDHSVTAQQIGGSYETPPEPLGHNSHIALYPMTEDNHALYVKVMMPSMQYKAKIQGTNVRLEKCHPSGGACHTEDEASTKSSNLIQPQQWNYMYSQIRHGQITIGIGPVAKVMTMSDIPEEDLANAEWVISSGDGPRATEEADGQGGTKGGPFLVQFPCAEYVAQHLSTTELPLYPRTEGVQTDPSYGLGSTAAHAGYTTEPTKTGDESEDHTAAIVVGVVVALLLVALVVAMAISIHRKRNNFKVNESTPLSDQKKTPEVTSQEQQQPEKSEQQEVQLHDEK